MFTIQKPRVRHLLREPGAARAVLRRAVPALLVLAVLPVAAGAAPRGDRIDRQVGLFERVVDGTLVDSPNWLVQSRDNTRGTYLSGYGAVFTFKASLVDRVHHRSDKWWSWFGKDVVVLRGDDDDRDRDRDWKDQMKETEARALADQEKRYRRGIDELKEMLLDYGDMLSGLSDDDWVQVEADLERAEYFEDHDLGRLTLKIKAGDLRAYADHRLDEDQALERIRVEES